MMHISEDQMLELAEKTANHQLLTSEQFEYLEHLKKCKECYEQFCVFSMMVDATSGNYIDTVLAPQKLMSEVISKSKHTIYAVLDVVVTRVNSIAKVTMEQVHKLEFGMEFGPALAMATRGIDNNLSNGVRYEDIEDEKTYIFYEPDKRELVIQINSALVDAESVMVCVKYETGKQIDVPMIKKGKMFYVSIADVHDDKFSILVEAAEE